VGFRGLLSLQTGLDWSPYDLLEPTLLGPGLQNHSARLFKLRCLLRGRGILIRSLDETVGRDAYETGCNGCPLTPSHLRSLLGRGELARWRGPLTWPPPAERDGGGGGLAFHDVVVRMHRRLPVPDAQGKLVGNLRLHCRNRLGGRSPRKIVVLKELPLGPTGKPLRRGCLPKPMP